MSVKEYRAQRQAREARLCTGTRAFEWVLVAAALWAALVMSWTPTLLRNNPPPFYRAIDSFAAAWMIGAVIFAVAFLHGAGLLLSRCGITQYDDSSELQESAVPCQDCLGCRRERVGATLRQVGAFLQIGVWVFLTALYAWLWLDHGDVTFGSGACAIFAVIASGTSRCISKERALTNVRGEIARLTQDTQSPREMLTRMQGMK